MSDLIRREDAIDAITNIDTTIIPFPKAREYVEIGFNIVINRLKELPSAEPERKWIPVTETLPKEKEIVLITNNKGHVRCGQYQGTFDDKNYRWWWKHNTLEEVLAWKPLPEPWRGE